jgi:catechol 2,3-dioxygenase-like lactoylglutathione lyase family enzyme
MTKLDHCNIRTFDLDATVEFYTDVVDLRDGEFPGPRQFGAWLYDTSDRPILHVISIDPKDPEIALGRIRERIGSLGGEPLSVDSIKGTGTIDHIAFECSDYDAMEAKLKKRGLKYTSSDVPRLNLRQLFVNDPNGVTLELNFR